MEAGAATPAATPGARAYAAAIDSEVDGRGCFEKPTQGNGAGQLSRSVWPSAGESRSCRFADDGATGLAERVLASLAGTDATPAWCPDRGAWPPVGSASVTSRLCDALRGATRLRRGLMCDAV